ncbi:MAG: DUF3768 domain-containing protein [Litorimonas sp.]
MADPVPAGPRPGLHDRSASNAVWARYLSELGRIAETGGPAAHRMRCALADVTFDAALPQMARAPAAVWRVLDDLLWEHLGDHDPVSGQRLAFLDRFRTIARPTPAGLLADLRRRTLQARYIATAALAADLDPKSMADLIDRVRSFDAFDVSLDPTGDRDFGALQFAGRTVYFAVTVFDAEALSAGSERRASDASDPSKTHHVVTLMTAHDL